MQGDIETSVVFKWNYECDKPVVVNQGGTSSGKTYSLLQVLFVHLINEPNIVITVAGQDIPNLKVGALRDAENIVRTCPVIADGILSYNKTDRVYTAKNGSRMEFNSYDDEQDAKSGKRDYLFINEANGVPYDVYKQLALRTSRQVFVDYNPSEEFWVHENLINQPDTQLFISTYKDNPFIDPKVKVKIERLQFEDPELWKVYGLGLTGKIEGLVFRNYFIVPGIPPGAVRIGSGLDFGFSNDPTSYVDLYKYDNELWADELIYETGLTNPDIAEALNANGVSRNQEIIADSCEPKSIQELNNMGYNVVGATKGPDSVRVGINILKRFKLNITQRSTGMRKEIKQYKWKVKNGKALNEPVDFMNHSMDVIRYIAIAKLGENEATGKYAIY